MTDTHRPIPDDCVVFDTESTGLEVSEGHRLVELGAVRMRNGLPTKETFHTYINPQRNVDPDAEAVHGLSNHFLQDKPLFGEIVYKFLSFVGDFKLAAHNAAFDKKFINAELQKVGLPPLPDDRFVDTLPIARKKFPGAQASLDALCRRFNINTDSRDKHGALIDSILLAEVCVELNGGRQASMFDSLKVAEQVTVTTGPAVPVRTFIQRATPEELARHQELIATIPNSIWAKLAAREAFPNQTEAA